jgi:hypothetical protein
MRHALIATVAAATAALTLAAAAAADDTALSSTDPVAAAADTATANDAPALTAAACGSGTVVVFALERVLNDADSGVAGNAWAFDNYWRRLIVVRTGYNQYCVVTRYLGRFTTNEGTSPGGTGTVAAGDTGFFAGGYRSTTFTAKFTPAMPQLGKLGIFDYQCDTSFNCPGYVDWTKWYFNNGAGVPLTLAYWGWLYGSAGHGLWKNSITGNAGDITG